MKEFAVLFLLLICSYCCSAQSEKIIELPFDIQKNINGIPVTITVKKVKASRQGAFMDASFTFYHEPTKEYIRLEGEHIPFNAEGEFTNSFPLKPTQPLSPEADDYLQRLMKADGDVYRWRCSCTSQRSSL